MHSFNAWRDGVRRVASAPAVVVVIWITTMVVSVPLTLTIRQDIATSLGNSMAADAAARGVNYEWMQEFEAHATGIASTFRLTIVGFGAVLDNLGAYLDNLRPPRAIVVVVAVYAIVWAFLTGGVIHRYASDRNGFGGFLPACARYFFRFLRLATVTAILYAVLFGLLHRWMFDNVYPRLVAGVSVERTVFFVRLSLYAVFVLLLAAVNIVIDFAKIRAVVEDRRSVLVALAASWRFIRRNTAAAIGVYSLDAMSFGLVLALYSFLAPSAGGTGVMVWPAVLIGQAYVAGRVSVRLLFFASEVALFQNRHY
jgi:hypothetical protein